jgi:hypothetical protein
MTVDQLIEAFLRTSPFRDQQLAKESDPVKQTAIMQQWVDNRYRLLTATLALNLQDYWKFVDATEDARLFVTKEQAIAAYEIAQKNGRSKPEVLDWYRRQVEGFGDN